MIIETLPTGETGGKHEASKTSGWETVRKLTENQGARSTVYEVVNGPTGKEVQRERIGQLRSRSAKHPARKVEANTAEREHIARLLRACREKSEVLFTSTDPVDSALLGANLTGILNELWSYRKSREDDWIDILNLLQICLAKEVFETLATEKRVALVKIFEEGLLPRTVGRTELERTFQLLSESGFDVWRGIK